jgi:hypothetical protein
MHMPAVSRAWSCRLTAVEVARPVAIADRGIQRWANCGFGLGNIFF